MPLGIQGDVTVVNEDTNPVPVTIVDVDAEIPPATTNDIKVVSVVKTNGLGAEQAYSAHCVTVFGDWPMPSGECRFNKGRKVG